MSNRLHDLLVHHCAIDEQIVAMSLVDYRQAPQLEWTVIFAHSTGQVILSQELELFDRHIGSSESEWKMAGDLDTCAIWPQTDTFNDPVGLTRPPHCLKR